MVNIINIYIILCILQNINTDEMKYKNSTKEEMVNESYYENMRTDNKVTRDNETSYFDLNQNTTNVVASADNEMSKTTQRNVYENKDIYVRDCPFKEDVFIFDGQVVTAIIGSDRPPHLSVYRCKPRFKVDAIYNMSMTENVFQINLEGIKWPSIPESSIAQKAYLKDVTPVALWGGCSKLTELAIVSPNLTLTPTDWLANCTKLITLELSKMKLSDIKFILNSVARVEELLLKWNYEIDKIGYIPLFPSARGAHEWITKLEIDSYGINMGNIESGLVAAANMSSCLVRQLSLLTKLKILKMADLKYFDFCATNGNLGSVTLPSLQDLKMHNTDTHDVCFRESRKMQQLNILDLNQNNFNSLKFGELFSTSSPQLYVSLELTFVKQFTFLRDDYLALTKGIQKSNVTLNFFRYIMECDCGQSLWLARALNEGVVTAPGVNCRDGSDFDDQNCDWLHCKRVPCNNDCVCCIDEPGTVVGDCRDANISALPEDLLNWSNLTALLVPYNNLTQLPNTLPENLKWLDLSGNDVFRKSGEAELSALFASPDRHVLLSGNAIICSCDTQPFIRILQDHKDQIDDYENLTCAGDNLKLSSVEVSALCTVQDRQKSIILAVSLLFLIALLSLLLSAGYYYRRSIQIYLFARGWCLFCVKEEELDADRVYDVFLSFCYEDDRTVMEELLPVLDNEYSVCVHYRDWGPGDMIPVQITRSVEQSRRTVVVVSRNFIKSLWGLLEFRTAHVSGLAEGRVRVVMIILDDVLEDENLEAEVKAYVRLNTYVKWGDPWFWDKLKFALPHRPTPFQRNLNNERLSTFLNNQLPMIEMPPDDDMLQDNDTNR